MNADTAFVTGKSHRVCQDYARSDKTNGSYVVLSDGCSSAPDSDFGSRLLVKNAELVISVSPETLPPIVNAVTFAKLSARSLDLPEFCTDATLLIQQVIGENVITTAWGDGAIAARHVDGSIHVWNLNYASGYPMYPSYLVDHDRMKTITGMFKGNSLSVDIWTIEQDGTPKLIETRNLLVYPFSLTLPKKDYTTVAIFSDGVQSFVDNKLQFVPMTKVVFDLMEIPAHKGQFVQRQINWMEKEYGKIGWKHDDDVSMGAINL